MAWRDFAGPAARLDILPTGCTKRCLLTHVTIGPALNPFGFAWLRRVNEDNVDLNRNFQDFSSLPLSAGYEAFHDYLVPKEWEGDERLNADAALQKFILARRKRISSRAQKGQYARPNGLFYGGREASWSNRVLRQILADNVLETVRRVAVLDIHTGLGKPGFGEPIYVGPIKNDYETAKKWYGQEVKSTTQGTSVSSDYRFCGRRLPAIQSGPGDNLFGSRIWDRIEHGSIICIASRSLAEPAGPHCPLRSSIAQQMRDTLLP